MLKEKSISSKINKLLYHRKLIIITIIIIIFIYVIITDIIIIKRINYNDQFLKKKIEESKIALETKQQFLSTMSHEIRTPLNGIIGITNLLKNFNYPPEQKELINTLENASKSLLMIINDILDLSKIEDNKIKITKEEFCLEREIIELIDMFVLEATKKNIELILKYDSSIPNVLIGDYGKLKQILYNLLSNAIKFTEKGHVKLSVVKKAEANNNVVLDFSVEDTGIGIKKENIEEIFNPFYQIQQTRIRKSGGTGLGLAITKNLINILGGDIKVNSVENKGTSFKFTLSFEKSGDIIINQKDFLKDYHIFFIIQKHEMIPIYEDIFNFYNVKNFTISDDMSVLFKEAEKSSKTLKKIIIIDEDILFDKTKNNEAIRFLYQYKKSTNIYLYAKRINERLIKIIKLYNLYLIQKPFTLSKLFNVLIGHNYFEKNLVNFKINKGNKIINKLKNKKILVVDDNELNRDIIKSFLIHYEVNVETSDNGFDAINKCLTNDFDAIIMDYHMPVMDGIEATK
ncbi:response regulator [Deferribacter autotrophicus]|uniref:histidine kinase n=1 Tax=Deferribacter autotrophicus TaxID=500465 RepID=A0A5A8F2R1_9BACT|nr:ATP-binding protein [Deferribacter autotrophicus]KAA0258232.1 response regulator [Deferribacter autotrophicus]